MRGQLPLLLGVAPFGMAFGAYAIETGISGGMTQAMSCPGDGDADGNGVTNIVDATVILQFSAGMISRLPT